MKKLLIAMMCVSLLSGCANNDTPNNDNNATGNGVNDTGNGVNDTAQSWYGNFENGLKNKNVSYSSKTSLDASTIGGVEGYRYATQNGNIDIYRYEDGEELNRIMKDKNISVNGATQEVEVNDHYVIVTEGVSDEVLNIFRGLK